MNDVTASWDASPSNNVTGYQLVYTQNGTALPAVTIARTAALDASGYTSDFAAATGVTPNPGDVIGASLVVVDATDKLQGPTQNPTPETVTIPTAPVAPQAAPNFTLALS